MKFLLSVFLCLSALFLHSQSQSKRAFIFGHSLIDHGLPIVPTPSDETKIPHWIFLLAQEAGNNYAAGGQYGFLPQHANLPPISQWGYDLVPPVWESDIEPFSDADIDHIMITAGNFVQWQGPAVPYFGGDGVQSPVTATIDIMDWVEIHEPGSRIYIYENWPDMGPYLSSGFPPNASEWTIYNDYTTGDFHDWWVQYHDLLLQSRPDLLPRMIPVGPIIEGLLTETPLNTIPVTDLYEDDAPHGLPTIYFLAGLITYMAIYEEVAPVSFTVPSIIHSTVSTNYNTVVNYIWNELINFNDSNGESRVFYPSTVPVEWVDISARRQMDDILISWSVASEINVDHYIVQRSQDGINYTEIGKIQDLNENGKYEYTDLSSPRSVTYYRIKEIDLNGNISFCPVVQVGGSDIPQARIFPNPSNGDLTVYLNNNYNQKSEVKVYSLDGSLQYQTQLDQSGSELNIDLNFLKSGLYFLEVSSANQVSRHRLFLQN